MTKTITIQDLINFYDEQFQDYVTRYKKAEIELLEGRLDEEEAYYKNAEMEQHRLIGGLIGGFLENLKKVEENK